MRAFAIFQTADGVQHELGHGDIIGRLWSARLQLASPDISEAHALVSLRGGELHLLALRGIFAYRGKPTKDLVLAAGQTIHFSRDIATKVIEVVLPKHTLGVEGDGLVRQPLRGVASLRLLPQPALSQGVHPAADAVFFAVDDAWMVRTAAGTTPLDETWTLAHDNGEVRAVRIALSRAGQQATVALNQLETPLRIETHFDSVHIHREGAPTVTVTGHAARIISDLGAAGTSLPWEDLASALWTDEIHRDHLRSRFDAVLARTRRKLRQEGLRTNLLSPDGAGNLALLLRPGDQLDDRS